MSKKTKSIKRIKQPVGETLPMTTFQSADLIISNLANKNVDTDKLEKLLEIKGKYEAEENKKLFQKKFADLQSELPVIKKTKKVFTNEGQLAYQYAPLEKIIEQIKPILKNHGFSFRWSEGLIEKDGYKRMHCHIMACGHEEITFCDIPIPPGNKLVNNAQMAGSASTYGKRYSLIGALGIMADEDNDGTTIINEYQAEKKTYPIQRKEDAIEDFSKLYNKVAKNKNAGQALQEFMAQIETMTTEQIQEGTKRLHTAIEETKMKKYLKSTKEKKK